MLCRRAGRTEAVYEKLHRRRATSLAARANWLPRVGSAAREAAARRVAQAGQPGPPAAADEAAREALAQARARRVTRESTRLRMG